jgi:EpsI family protein
MNNRTFAISTAIFLSTIVLVIGIQRRGEPVVAKTNLENLPIQIGSYRATEDFLEDSVYRELNADLNIYRHYRSNDGKQVDLYIGYYGTAKGGRTSHTPYACLPGSGWGITAAHKVVLKPAHYQEEVQVNYILARKGDLYDTILFWYQSERNKVLCTGIQQNVAHLLGRLFNNRSDGAFVQLSVYTKHDDTGQAIRLARSFAERLLDILPEHWPVER